MKSHPACEPTDTVDVGLKIRGCSLKVFSVSTKRDCISSCNVFLTLMEGINPRNFFPRELGKCPRIKKKKKKHKMCIVEWTWISKFVTLLGLFLGICFLSSCKYDNLFISFCISLIRNWVEK